MIFSFCYVHKVFLYRFFSISCRILIRLISINKIKSPSKSSGLSKKYFICYSRPCTGPDIFAKAYRCLYV